MQKQLLDYSSVNSTPHYLISVGYEMTPSLKLSLFDTV